jgi:hypothetical protein
MSFIYKPKDAAQALHLRTRAAFVGQGTTLNAWCKENGAHLQNVRNAFFGRWTGKKATLLLERVTKAAEVQ